MDRQRKSRRACGSQTWKWTCWAARVTRSGRRLELTQKEYQLLEYLMRRTGQVVTRTMLLENVWDLHFDPQTNVIDVHMSRLRSAVDRASTTHSYTPCAAQATFSAMAPSPACDLHRAPGAGVRRAVRPVDQRIARRGIRADERRAAAGNRYAGRRGGGGPDRPVPFRRHRRPRSTHCASAPTAGAAWVRSTCLRIRHCDRWPET